MSSATLDALERRLNDLTTFQLPRLRACRGPAALHAELASEARLDLADVDRALAVEREVGESVEWDDPREWEGLRARMDGMEVGLVTARETYRSAILESKRKMTARLLSRHTSSGPGTGAGAGAGAGAGTDSPVPDDPSGAIKEGNNASSPFTSGADDAVQTKTNEVTDALRRTTQIMQAELERSVLSVQMLESSTDTLRTTSTLYDTYTSLLSSSSTIVRALERADWYDRVLVLAAFAFFLLVVGWVVKRRVLDKVAGGVGWWLGGSVRLVRRGLGGAGAGVGKVADIAQSGSGVLGEIGSAVQETAAQVAATATGIATASASPSLVGDGGGPGAASVDLALDSSRTLAEAASGSASASASVAASAASIARRIASASSASAHTRAMHGEL